MLPNFQRPMLSRLRTFARSVQRAARRHADPAPRCAGYIELRAEACDHGQALNLNDLKLMVAKNLLLDLATQGWCVSIRAGKISLLSRMETNAETAERCDCGTDIFRSGMPNFREPSVVVFHSWRWSAESSQRKGGTRSYP